MCFFFSFLSRFINLISHLGQVDLRHQPISAIAEMAGIPDWVVSIRHEATHAKMPSLDILRPGIYHRSCIDIHKAVIRHAHSLFFSSVIVKAPIWQWNG